MHLIPYLKEIFNNFIVENDMQTKYFSDISGQEINCW
jgi:hypothetical protein